MRYTLTSATLAASLQHSVSASAILPRQASYAPTPTQNSTCYVTAYSAVPAATAACTSITLDGIHVPGNQTLDLSKLLAGTTVTFAGLTTFGFAEVDYNLIEVGGTDINITAADGAIVDGNGQAWWDGQGRSHVSLPLKGRQ